MPRVCQVAGKIDGVSALIPISARVPGLSHKRVDARLRRAMAKSGALCRATRIEILFFLRRRGALPPLRFEKLLLIRFPRAPVAPRDYCQLDDLRTDTDAVVEGSHLGL